MKTVAFLFFNLLITNVVFSQQQAIKLTNQKTNKEIVIKENKRIRIKTVNDRKVTGRYKIENNAIYINNERFELSTIKEIKKNPLLTTIVSSSLLIYTGALVTGISVIAGLFADSSAYYLTIPGVGLIIAGSKTPNFNKKYRLDENWSIELITTND